MIPELGTDDRTLDGVVCCVSLEVVLGHNIRLFGTGSSALVSLFGDKYF